MVNSETDPKHVIAMYKNLFENASTQLAYLDGNYNFLMVNSAYSRGSGHTAAELIGHNYFEIFPNEEYRRIFTKVKETGQGITVKAKGFLEYPGQGVSYYDWSFNPVNKANGEIQGFILALSDVTELIKIRQQLEKTQNNLPMVKDKQEQFLERLQDEQNWFWQILEEMPVGVNVIENSGRIIFRNKKLTQIWGYLPSELNCVEDLFKFQGFHSNGRPYLLDEWPICRSIIKGETVIGEEISIIRGDGAQAVIQVDAIPIRDDENNIIGGVSVTIETTERKEEEKSIMEYANTIIEARDEAEQRAAELDATIASIASGVIIYNNQGYIIRINEFARNLTGFTDADYQLSLAEHIVKLNFCKPDGTPYAVQETPLYRALQGEIIRGEELIIYRNPDEPIWLSATLAPIFDSYYQLTGVTFIFTDITQRTQQSQERIVNILESITDAFYSLDKDFCITYLNKEAKRLFYREEELIGKPVWDVFPKEKYPDYYENFQTAMREQTAIHFESYNPLGQCFEFHVYPSPDGLSVYVHDISDRIKFEKELESERELLSVTLDSLNEGVIATDREERIILINEIATKLTGYTPDEALGKPLYKVLYIIDDKTSEPFVLTTQKFLSNPVLVTRDLNEIPVSVHSSPIRANDDRMKGTVIIFQDISEKQKTEQELKKAEKLESLGILAGGIAHDFNNILAAILSNVQLALMKQQKNEDNKKYLLHTVEITRNASELTKQLLTFSKGGAPVKKDASLNELIEDTTRFVLRGTNTKADFAIPEDLWGASIDEAQISQVIHNLVLNANQAMPQGGIIRISAENMVVEEESHLKPGKYVKITVRDQGVGIPRENLSKIYDPFFTTKKDGNGLGLTTSYSIMKKHNGYIDVESREDNGTTFFIYLPAIYPAPEHTKTLNEVAAARKCLKILLMDDEIQILNAVGEMLRCYGYRVELAVNGSQAIDIYREAKNAGEPFDVVIMDLTIPGGLGGREAISILRGIDPDITAIVSSGYANDPIMADCEQYGFKGMVIKPYKFDELNGVLNKVVKGKYQ